MTGLASLARGVRLAMARLPAGRVPDSPAIPVRDPWPGEPARGARLMRGELEVGAAARLLRPGDWADHSGAETSRAMAHGFTWLRDLRALGTDAARTRARQLAADWIATTVPDPVALRPDVLGARLASWLGHYDFFAASADDAYRARLVARLVADARLLAAKLPWDGPGGLTALKGLVAAAVCLPDYPALLTRALRLMPAEIERHFLPDGFHVERNPAAHLAALQDLVEMRALLQAAGVPPPPALASAIDRTAPALRVLRHGDGTFFLCNGGREGQSATTDQVLTQAGRGGRAPGGAGVSGFHRLQAGRTVLLVDGGTPPPPGRDRHAHAGVLSFEMSVGRDRLIVNCGAAPEAGPDWRDAMRATAAHSTLVIADTNSSELLPDGLGRRPQLVAAERQEANGAHWLELSHDGYLKPFGAVHRRRLYLSESGDDLRGEDVVEATQPQDFTLRFHLHPAVIVSMAEDGGSVVLRLGSASWRFRADAAALSLEDSLYLGGTEMRQTRQIVLTATKEDAQQIKWGIGRLS